MPFPFGYPAQCQTVTSTTGTNPYVLDTADIAGEPLQTPKQAVAKGVLFDGDIILYMCIDATVLGDADYELGQGTYTDATNEVSRLAADVFQGTNGPGVLKSWPGSGQRDFFIVGIVNPAREDVANIFTEQQNISTTGSVPFIAKTSNATRCEARIVATDEGAGIESAIAFLLQGTDSVNTAAARIVASKAQQWTATATTKDGVLEILIRSDNVLATRVKIDDVGEIEHVATGDSFDHFPSGTVMIFGNTAAPVGWTKSVAADNAALRIVSGTVTAGGGTRNLNDTAVGNTTLTITQIPSHTHPPVGSDVGIQHLTAAGGGTVALAAGADVWNARSTTGSTGGGGAHSHGLALKFTDAIKATKDVP